MLLTRVANDKDLLLGYESRPLNKINEPLLSFYQVKKRGSINGPVTHYDVDFLSKIFIQSDIFYFG